MSEIRCGEFSSVDIDGMNRQELTEFALMLMAECSRLKRYYRLLMKANRNFYIQQINGTEVHASVMNYLSEKDIEDAEKEC